MPPSAIARSVCSTIVARRGRRRSARARAAGTAARTAAGTSAGRRSRRVRVEALRELRGASRRGRLGRPLARAASLPAADRGEPRHDLVGRRVDVASRSSRHARAISWSTSANAGPPLLRRRREVGAAVERLQLRRQPHAHRPAAAARRRLHERHVDAVDVGPLFAIHLDRARSRAFSTPRCAASSNDSCSITWHQWHVE